MKENQININNYEAWLLDYSEGNLSKNQTLMLTNFMENHPEFKDDYEMVFDLDFLDAIISNDNQKLTTRQKESLKFKTTSTISENNYEDFLIGNLEGLLSETEKAELKQFVSNNPIAFKDQTVFQKTVLIPDSDVIYQNKNELKKSAPIILLFSNNYLRFSAAASILLLISFYFFNTRNTDILLKLADNKVAITKPTDSTSKEVSPIKEIEPIDHKILLPKTENGVSNKALKVPGANPEGKQIELKRQRIQKLKLKENPSQIYFYYEDSQIAFVELTPEVIPSINYFPNEELAEAKPKSNEFQTINEAIGKEIDSRLFNTEEPPKEGRLMAAANKLLGKVFDSEIIMTQDTTSKKNELVAFYSPFFEIERKK